MKEIDKHILARFIDGSASPQEKQQVLAWISLHEDNRRQYLSARRLWEMTLWHAEEPEEMRQARPRRCWLGRIVRYAAVFLLAAVLTQAGAYFLSTTDAATQQVIVPAGQRAELVLSDGTKVWLNSGSTFTFPSRFGKKDRAVALDGEGYFEVRKNPARPFIVRTEKYDVHVTGTTFNLYSYSEGDVFEASLLEGSVHVRPHADPTLSYKMEPGEKLCDHHGRLFRDELHDHDGFLWRNGIYYFNNERFEDIFKKLEQYYDISIIVRDTKALDYRLTGKFRQKEGIEHIMRVLQKDKPLRYLRDDKNNSIVIY